MTPSRIFGGMESTTGRRAAFVLLVTMSSTAACFSKQDLGDTPDASSARDGDVRDVDVVDVVDAASSTCPKQPCPETEVCYQGICRPRSNGGACSRDHLRQGIDDCPVDAMCLSGLNDSAYCKTLEPCGPGDTCAAGAQGSVCNTGYVAEKAYVCLYGQCVATKDCPQGFECLTTIGVLGFCSNGDPGSACVTTKDCKNGTCASVGAGFGICF